MPKAIKKHRERRNAVLTRDDNRCHYCKQQFYPSALTLDHKVPLAAGGTWALANLVAACRRCNGAKAARSYEAFVVNPNPVLGITNRDRKDRKTAARELLHWLRAIV